MFRRYVPQTHTHRNLCNEARREAVARPRGATAAHFQGRSDVDLGDMSTINSPLPHMKASCLRLTEQFHPIEIHFDISADVRPFGELSVGQGSLWRWKERTGRHRTRSSFLSAFFFFFNLQTQMHGGAGTGPLFPPAPPPKKPQNNTTPRQPARRSLLSPYYVRRLISARKRPNTGTKGQPFCASTWPPIYCDVKLFSLCPSLRSSPSRCLTLPLKMPIYPRLNAISSAITPHLL